MFEEFVSAIAGYVTEMQTGIAVGEAVHGLPLSVIGFLIICIILFRVGLALDAASRRKEEERPEFIDL